MLFYYRIKIYFKIIFICFINSAFYLEVPIIHELDLLFFLLSPRPFNSFSNFLFILFIYFNQLLYTFKKTFFPLVFLAMWPSFSVIVYYLFSSRQSQSLPDECFFTSPIAWPYLPWIPKPLLDFFFLKDHNLIKVNYYCYCCCYFITIYFFKVFIFLNVDI